MTDKQKKAVLAKLNKLEQKVLADATQLKELCAQLADVNNASLFESPKAMDQFERLYSKIENVAHYKLLSNLQDLLDLVIYHEGETINVD